MEQANAARGRPRSRRGSGPPQPDSGARVNRMLSRLLLRRPPATRRRPGSRTAPPDRRPPRGAASARCPRRVGRRPRRPVVDGPVELDREALGRAVNVYGVRPDPVLPLEPPPADLPVLEQHPQPRLSRRPVRLQVLLQRRLAQAVEQMAHRRRKCVPNVIPASAPPFAACITRLRLAQERRGLSPSSRPGCYSPTRME